MSYGKALLADSRIKALCLKAWNNETQLDIALEEIYRKGFEGTPQLEEAPKLFVGRLKEIREEFFKQLKDCQDDPARWQLRQLNITSPPTQMVASMILPVATTKGTQARYPFLDLRMEIVAALRQENLELLEENSAQVAGILAMCSYVTIKREPDVKVHPEMSFDMVCIWSNAVMEILRQASPPREALAAVSCAMAAQHMRISEWEVLKAAMESLCSLNDPVMTEILENICLELLPQKEPLSQKQNIKDMRPRKGKNTELSQMEKSAKAAVIAAVAATRMIPFPFANGSALLMEQVVLIASICKIFEINMKEDGLKALATASGVFASTQICQTVATGILNMIPGGVCGVASGAQSSCTADVVTYAMGNACIDLCIAIKSGELKENEIATTKGKKLFANRFADHLQKRATV